MAEERKDCPFCGGKRAPVKGFAAGIPWEMHLRAYDAYCKRYSPQEALIQGGCRGGFSTGELDMFIPGWREELSSLAVANATIARLERRVETLEAALEPTKAEARARELLANDGWNEANGKQGIRTGSPLHLVEMLLSQIDAARATLKGAQ